MGADNNVMDEEYYRTNYNTPSSAENQQRFKNWTDLATKTMGVDTSDLYDYDMQGYWLNGGSAQTLKPGMHFPDTYKKPSHETFSNQSIYHGTPSPYGGTWQGGTWDQNDKFQPSEWQQKYQP